MFAKKAFQANKQ